MLKLPRLPDRTPVRLTVTLDARLNAALKEYAALDEATYGETDEPTVPKRRRRRTAREGGTVGPEPTSPGTPQEL